MKNKMITLKNRKGNIRRCCSTNLEWRWCKNPKSYTVTEELTILDFDKMSDFKKASNYLKKQGIQYKNPYPFVLTIHNIDKLSKIKTKRDVENFLKKGKFKFDIRYAESTEHKGTKLDEEQSKQIAKDIKKKFQAQLKRKGFLL